MEILKFIFADFWHFLGTVVLIGTITGGIARIVMAAKSKNDKENE